MLQIQIYIVYSLVQSNNLVHNWYFQYIIEENKNSVFNSTHSSQLWIMNLQKISSKLYILNSIKHNNISYELF